jgi:hypothetical protein
MKIPFSEVDKVTVLPVRKKSEGRPVELVQKSFTDCKHIRVEVDPELMELTCRDCKLKLNPIQYIVRVAQQFVSWEYERDRIKLARAQLEERKQCRCTKCGQMTEVRRVSDRELAKIKGQI